MSTELLSKGALNAKAEIALMGRPVKITDRDNLAYAIDYICKVLKCTETSGAEILKMATQYSDEKVTRPIGLVCNTIMDDMKCLTVILKDFDGSPFKLDSENGVLCWTYNFTCPEYSELGYCFFEKIQGSGSYRRIG